MRMARAETLETLERSYLKRKKEIRDNPQLSFEKK
jgi:hypothetical protein